MSTMYRCTGSCQGVSEQPGTCQGEDCELHGHPLVACNQCEGCSAATAEDGAPHACSGCEAC